MTVPRSLAERLRALRSAAGLTLDGLSELSGVSARALSDIEREVSTSPQPRTLTAIADALALPSSERASFLRAGRSRRGGQFGSHKGSAIAPHRVGDFTGRDREITEVRTLLSNAVPGTAAQVVLVTGPAGVGKTTVALEALSGINVNSARTLFVDLDGFSAAPLTPLQVLRALLRQMPGIEDAIPADVDAAAHLWQTATRDNPVSILLDNASHESQIRPILSIDPRNVILVTSRRSLAGIEAVRRIHLGPFGVDESIAFLNQLIPPEQRRAGDLRELATLCDHVPLALRIVGNKIASRPSMQTADFLVRLRVTENRLRLLVAGDLAVEAAFALSYDELNSATASLFRSMSVIEGTTFDARLAAATEGIDVLDAEEKLDELIDLGLLEARGGNRYRIHDLLHLYATQCLLREAGMTGVLDTRRRVRRWILGSLERAGAWFEPNRVSDMPGHFGAAFPDAKTAEEWIRVEELHWWPALQSASTDGDDLVVSDVADALHWFSELWIEWGHWRELFALAVTSARALGDHRVEAMHLGYVVWSIVIETRDFEKALDVALQAVAAAELSGDPTQNGWSNFYASWILHLLDRSQESAVYGRSAVEYFRVIADIEGAVQAINVFMRADQEDSAHEAAIESLREMLTIIDQDTSEKYALVGTLTRLSAYECMIHSHIELHRYDEAIAIATTAIELARGFSAPSRMAGILRRRVEANVAAGNAEAAEIDIEAALAGLDGAPPDDIAKRERERLAALRAQAAAIR